MHCLESFSAEVCDYCISVVTRNNVKIVVSGSFPRRGDLVNSIAIHTSCCNKHVKQISYICLALHVSSPSTSPMFFWASWGLVGRLLPSSSVLGVLEADFEFKANQYTKKQA